MRGFRQLRCRKAGWRETVKSSTGYILPGKYPGEAWKPCGETAGMLRRERRPKVNGRLKGETGRKVENSDRKVHIEG
jgi:hypothetical protein